WLTDLFLSLPALPLLLLIIYLFRDGLKALVGPQLGVFILIVAVIGGLRWMQVARLVRAQFLSLREKEFVEAARALGATRWRQVVRHILPNSLGPVIVAGTVDVAAAIIAESTLSFLGLGFPPDIPTWGRILYDAKDYLDIAPHWALFAGGAIFLAVLSINFVGDGLRDALDPRRHGPGGRRRRSGDCRRRDARRRRRVRLRQDGDRAVRPQARGDAAGAHRRRADSVAGTRPGAARSVRDAGDPQQGDRHRLSGADDLAEPGLQRRRADRRGRPRARGGEPRRRIRARRRDAAPRAHPQPRTAGARLSAPVLRRHAAAGDDRDGAVVQSQAADRRRADHRARRDDPGADSRTPRRDEGPVRHGGDADHPCDGGGRLGGGAGRGHVCRPGGRGGAGRRAVRGAASPLYPGADPLDPADRPRRRQEG